MRAAARPCDDAIRTNSHTPLPALLPLYQPAPDGPAFRHAGWPLRDSRSALAPAGWGRSVSCPRHPPGRQVAIKFSAEKFSERFEREARAVAALNHPHICTLYDVGPNYLVMELVDGQPLAGPLPLERALLFARKSSRLSPPRTTRASRIAT